ncbi:hypothetical protein D3C87_1496810 [compost metagenome]
MACARSARPAVAPWLMLKRWAKPLHKSCWMPAPPPSSRNCCKPILGRTDVQPRPSRRPDAARGPQRGAGRPSDRRRLARLCASRAGNSCVRRSRRAVAASGGLRHGRVRQWQRGQAIPAATLGGARRRRLACSGDSRHGRPRQRASAARIGRLLREYNSLASWRRRAQPRFRSLVGSPLRPARLAVPRAAGARHAGPRLVGRPA